MHRAQPGTNPTRSHQRMFNCRITQNYLTKDVSINYNGIRNLLERNFKIKKMINLFRNTLHIKAKYYQGKNIFLGIGASIASISLCEKTQDPISLSIGVGVLVYTHLTVLIFLFKHTFTNPILNHLEKKEVKVCVMKPTLPRNECG